MIPWIYIFILLILSTIMLLSLGLYGAFSGLLIGRKAFSFLMFSLAIYSCGHALQMITPSLEWKIFWVDFYCIGSWFFGPCFIVLALIYSGKSRYLNKWTIFFLLIIPLIGIFLKLTDNYFHLVYKTTFIDIENPYPVISFTKGPFYWLFIVYLSICVLAGNILFITVYFQSATIFRKQAGIMMIASLIPWVGYVASQIGVISILKGLDYNPLVLAIVGPLFALGLVRYRLFDAQPLKWKTILETVTNDMIILDNNDNIVDFTPGSQKLFKGLNKKSIGKPFLQSAAVFPEILKLTGSPDRFQSDIRIESRDGSYLLRAQVFYLFDYKDNVTGKTIVITNIPVKSKSQIDPELLAGEILEIEKIMENEKLYLNPDLTLPGLSEILNIPRTRLSIILNEYKKNNFYDFLSTYRIREAKKLMNSGAHIGNILQIAYDSGFNSKSTFYKAFKKITGMTPTEYLSKKTAPRR